MKFLSPLFIGLIVAVGGVWHLCHDTPESARKMLLAASTMHAHAGTVSMATGVMHKNKITLPVSPRFQWQANFGYCGETALISAGLYYGQYVSQYDARAYASKNKNQNERASQLLLGVNETTAANAMHLNIEKWKGSGANNFLAWVKKNIIRKHPVVIGVYQNMSLFEDLGDAEYDHIVPITGIATNHSLTDDLNYNCIQAKTIQRQ